MTENRKSMPKTKTKTKKQELTLRPGPGRILVEIDEEPMMSPGGIILPDNVKVDPIEVGQVLSVSTVDHWDGAKCVVHAGDIVYFRNFSLFDIKVEGGEKKLGVLEFQDVLAYDQKRE